MNKLAVIILTHRDDKRFERALASAAFADEIIVMTFGHVRPKLSLPQARILIGGEKITDFSLVRNQALAEATAEWVLFLDSDETISPLSIDEIKKVIQQPGTAGVYIQRQDIFHGQLLKYGETGQHWLLRLGLREKMKFVRPVHEVARVDGVSIKAPILILHHAHPTISDFWLAISEYSRREAEYRIEQKQPFSLAQLLLLPPAKFMLNYVYKLGFLDGWRGFIYATMMSLHSLMVRIFWYEKTR